MDSKNNDPHGLKSLSFIEEIKSIVVIGPSEKRNFFFLRNHLENFKGKVYAVHPYIKQIKGFDDGNQGKIFKSVNDIPEAIDFAFIAVPAHKVPPVIEECVEKGVKLASIFAAGFSDAGTEEGRVLERVLLAKAQGKIRLLGPNGLGLFYPRLGIAWRPKFPTIAGNIGFIAQSGGICNLAVYSGIELGIYFSKVFSFGNGADLDFVDILYYLTHDPETDIILCYLEGIKERRVDTLKRVLSQNKKPIVVLKGGKSIVGATAAKTHTGSISGNDKIWNALFKQYNLIEVDSLEQLLFTARLIDFYGISKYENLAIFSISGGYGVILVDLLEKYGMKVPQFSDEVKMNIKENLFVKGTSPNNPLDVAAQLFYSDSIVKIIDLALSDKKMDALVLDIPCWYFHPDFSILRDEKLEKNLIKAFNLGHVYSKPLIPIIQRANCPEHRERISHLLTEKKVPIFGDPLEFIPLLPKISNSLIRRESSKKNN